MAAVTDSEQGTGRQWDAMKSREWYRVFVAKELIGINDSSNKELTVYSWPDIIKELFYNF